MPVAHVVLVGLGQDRSVGVDVGEDVAGVVQAGIEADEIGHGQDAGHPSGVIAKEDAAKGGESAHEVGLDRDRRLDPRDL